MLFSLQKTLGAKRLLVKLIVFSSIIHLIVLIGLFLGEKSWFGMETFEFSSKQSAARVSMQGDGKNPLGLPQPPSPTAAQNAIAPIQPVQGQLQEKKPEIEKKLDPIKVEPSEKSVAPLTPKPVVKKEEVKLAQQPKKKEAALVEKIQTKGKPEEKKASKKNESKQEPVFSELKKAFTSLKKEKSKNSYEKVSEKPVQEKLSEVKKDKVVKEQHQEKQKEVKQEQPKEAQTQNKSEPEKSQRAEHNQPVSSAIAGVAVPERSSHGAARQTVGAAGGQSVGAIGSGAVSEKIEFDAEAATWSQNDSVREFGRHFTLPPGFEEHEPITVTFELLEGKVVSMSPRAQEPLVIYTSIKDALIKMKWPATKHIKKIQFIIK